ncbi:MAG TPA: hypothetical protein VLB02_01170 [Candidatus Paceibacterota bacterium]|nr:hypothetical protein [Candidatus Paceibacterota bacterium]
MYDNSGNAIAVSTDSNTVRVVSNTLVSAGKVSLPQPVSSDDNRIRYHDTLYGKDYIGLFRTSDNGTNSNRFMVLNANSGKYEPVSTLPLPSTNSVDGFFDLGDSLVLLTGNLIYHVSSTYYDNAAVWNMRTNTLSRPCATEWFVCSNGSGGEQKQSVSSVDGTAMFISPAGSSFSVVWKGQNYWQGINYPTVPSGGIFTACQVIDKNIIYAAWSKDPATVLTPAHLMKFSGGAWESVIKFTRDAAPDFDDGAYADRCNINSIGQLGNLLYIAHTGDSANGVKVSNIVTFNMTNGEVKSVAEIPNGWSSVIYKTGKKLFQKSWVKILNAEVCLFETTFEALSHQEKQTVYILRDTTDVTKPAALTIVEPANAAVALRQQTVTFKATGAENNSKALFHFVFIGSGTANRTEWTDTVFVINTAQGVAALQRAFDQPGTCYWTVTPVDQAGNIGQESSERTLTISAVTGIGDVTNTSVIPSLYPNPVQGATQVIITNVKRVLHAVTVNGQRIPITFIAKESSVVLDVSRLIPGFYGIVCEVSKGKFITKPMIKQ